jgi:Meiotically up-regulated gene 113
MVGKMQILDEIKRLARANGGKAPGRERFESETGTKSSEWYPHYWLRWGDALVEAGFSPNKFQKAYDEELLLEKYIGLIRELKHVPVHGEVRRKEKEDPTFPSHTVFDRFGGKHKLVARVLDYCKERRDCDDIVEICSNLSSAGTQPQRLEKGSSGPDVVGFVYLIKFGHHYKIGRTNALGRREYELGIQLPEKARTVHVIKTDDPAGIETYWHKRFEAKRGNGEWFDLTSEDIRAFKRRKFM